LAKRSTQCQEYIIVHELEHLLERRHNVNFKG
jgi:predicted metal-dependent hydrolase